MTTTQHTPSPWNPSFGKIIASNGIEVCSMPSRDSANAHLIASAPVLLSALQGILESYAAYIDIDDATNADIAEPVAIARAAIAKAEGKQ